VAFFAFLVAVIAGVSNPFQAATNGELNKQLQRPIWAGIAVYATGLVGLLLVQAIVREALPVKNLGAVTWWAWMGGVISIISTMVGLTMVQRLGSGVFTGISLTAALVTSVLLDQFGVAGLRQHSATPGRMVGCALLIAGIWLVARS
jgi:transporter family-2 protein